MNERMDKRSVPDLLRDLINEVTALFRAESDLVRAEISDKISQIQVGGGSIAAGAICLLVALIVLVQALVIALANIMPAGWAALIVGVVLALIGAGLLMKGRSDLDPSNLAPNRTAEQLRKDRNLAKEQIS